MNKEAILTYYSHHFSFTVIQPRIKYLIESFARKYIVYKQERRGRYNQRVPDRVFAAATQDRSEYRFHINQLPAFKEHLKFNSHEMAIFEEVVTPMYNATRTEFIVQDQWKDRDHQPPIIDYLTNDVYPPRKFVNLQTGQGKSYCSMRAMQILAMRTLCLVRPMYVEKWVEDMRRTYHIAHEDILVVAGNKALQALLNQAEQGLITAKVIVISNKTLQFWIKEYEARGQETLELGFPCTPRYLCEILGIGIRLIDEVHQDFHLNFKIDLYTHVPRSISLSATLLGDDDFINRMYQIAYPIAERCEELALKKYVHSKGIVFRFRNPEKIKYKNSITKYYSHHEFEQSVIRHASTCSEYLRLISHCLDSTYIKTRVPGQKAIVYCASIEFCSIVTSYLSRKYLDLHVGRYVEEDPFSNLADSDIIVSTIQSAGTALDIAGLTTVLCTTAVNSSQANIQTLGRLREAEGVELVFMYFVCEDIPKHIEYHEKKMKMLAYRAASYKLIRIGNPV
jgi:superfamily II DNA or RNA helicase